MSIWPFRRKTGRKRSRSGAALSDAEGPATRTQIEGFSRSMSKKKPRTEPTKLQRRARTYSFSPGRQDDLGVERRRSMDRAGPSSRPPRDEAQWERTPTLHHKRSHPTRRKSSKRKREDQSRAAEIKAMSNFVPLRPATEQWNAGRPMKKESKRIKRSSFTGQPQSDVSLPFPASIHSSLSSDTEFGSYKVSILDSLAPRPTLRYAHGGRWNPTRSSAQSGSQRKPLGEKAPIREETLLDNKRINELADDLDAGDLRELMEREDRRREKKRRREQERAERRLARRQEQRRVDEEESRKSGTPPPQNLERGVVGRELAGLGLDPQSAILTSSRQRESSGSDAVAEPNEATTAESSVPLKPLDTFHRTDTIPRDDTVPALHQPIPEDQVPEEKHPDSATSLNQPSRLGGLLRSKKSRSKSTLNSDKDKPMSPPPDKIQEEESVRKSSMSSSKGARLSFTSLLRWGKGNRNSGGPSSFSNTSREEFQAFAASQGPAHAQAQALARLQGEDFASTSDTYSGNYLSRKPSSATTRLKSRFREDLPDFPVSPPDSRVQSPEADSLPALTEQTSAPGQTQPIPIPNTRQVSETSGRPRTPSSLNGMSPEPHQSVSMSLASIDSEASWLSSGLMGRKNSRVRDSLTRANRHGHVGESPSNSTQEDLAITDDDYLSRLAPQRNSAFMTSRRSGEGRPSSDEEDLGDEVSPRWGAVGATPQVVHRHRHDRSTMLSQEGLLNIESEGEDGQEEEEFESPLTPSAEEKADIRRARSVNLGGGHVRNFSAGSARLLDLTPRTSVDGKSRGLERRNSEPFL